MLSPSFFNATAVVLVYSAMPTPSPSAAAATDSDVSTAGDIVDVVITFKKANVNGENLHVVAHTDKEVEVLSFERLCHFRITFAPTNKV